MTDSWELSHASDGRRLVITHGARAFPKRATLGVCMSCAALHLSIFEYTWFLSCALCDGRVRRDETELADALLGALLVGGAEAAIELWQAEVVKEVFTVREAE